MHHSSSNSKLGIVVGCVLGGLVLALVVVLMLLRRSRRKQKGFIEPADASLDQQRLRSYRDDVVKCNVSLPFNQSSIYSENSGSGILHDQNRQISSLASEPATLIPVRREHQSSRTHSASLSQGEVRAVRQMEIDQPLQSAQQEMRNLTSRQSQNGGGHRPISSLSSEVRRQGMEHEMASMNEQIRQLETQIEHLQMERSSDWAEGFSDEPPPAYHSLS